MGHAQPVWRMDRADVVEHLAGVNRFWSLSIRAGLGGEPTRLLASFDPVRVPAAMVEAARGASACATLESFQATNAELAAVVASLTHADWDKPAEAPPGHVAIRAVALHALWDAWVQARRPTERWLALRSRPSADPVAVKSRSPWQGHAVWALAHG